MKQFKDLVPGDVIYYYSHCKMYPKTIVSINKETRVEHYRWGDRKSIVIDIVCDKGKPIHMICAMNGDYSSTTIGYTQVFACKEAAQTELDRLCRMRENEIRWQKARIKRFESYLEKYGFAK